MSRVVVLQYVVSMKASRQASPYPSSSSISQQRFLFTVRVKSKLIRRKSDMMDTKLSATLLSDQVLVLMYNVGAQGFNRDPCYCTVLATTGTIKASLEIQGSQNSGTISFLSERRGQRSGSENTRL